MISSDIFGDVWPVHGGHPITSAFGPRFVQDGNPPMEFHNGIDIGVDQVPVYSTDGNGIADWVDRIDDSPEGIWVMIAHDVPGHEPQTFYTIYCHLREIVEGLEEGDPIDEEDTYIGVSGETGDVTGPHLHYGFRPIPSDPEDGHINPLHNLSYDNQGEPQITDICYYPYDPNDPEPDPGDLITAFGWHVSYPSTDLDLNEVYVAFYYNGAWHSLNVNFDTRENVLYHNYFGGNIAMLTIYPSDYPYPPGYKTIGFTFTPLTFEMYYPIVGIFGMVVNDIAMPRCDDCEGEYLLPDCWWGNPECHSPMIGISSFDAELSNGAVLLSWVLHTTLGISGFNIWKAENIDGPFIKITEAPLPASEENGRYLFLDPNIEEGHEYFYKLQLVLHDSTEVFLDDMIASTGIISILPMSISLKSIYPNPFNNYTLITFTVGDGETDQIELTVFNMLGQKVRCLANGLVTPGNYTLLFDGLNDSGQQLASGVYLVNMKCGSYFKTKKISILR